MFRAKRAMSMQPSSIRFHCCFASVIVMVYGSNTSHIQFSIKFNTQRTEMLNRRKQTAQTRGTAIVIRHALVHDTRRRNVQRHRWQPHKKRKKKHIKFSSATVSWSINLQHIRFNSLLACWLTRSLARSFQFNSDAPPNAHSFSLLLLLLHRIQFNACFYSSWILKTI